MSTDYNGITTYGHYVDPFDRPTKTDYAIGWLLNVYGVPSGGQTEIDSYAAVGDKGATGSASCTLCTHTQALLDSLGRAVTGNLVNNPAGEVTVQSLYDGLNRVYSSSHPYMGSSDPNDVYENVYYDGFGRSVAIKHPDNEVARTAYGAQVGGLGAITTQQSSPTTYGYGFPVVSMDEAGKQRQDWIDGFGHVIEVDEPSTSTGTPATATLTVTGSEGTHVKNPNCGGDSQPICIYLPDTGTLTVDLNGFEAETSWGLNSTPASVAATLVTSLNQPLSPVTATASGATITMTSVAPAAAISYTVTQNGPYYDFNASPTSGTLSGGTGGLTSSPYVTTYTYEVLGNLTGVVQGSQSRSYQYDGLSRLIKETTPEAGTVTLSYVTTSGTLCSGNPSNPCSRTAPAPNQTGSATVTTTYTYNAANQLTQKTHSDSTGTETYTYGTNAKNYNIGRLTEMTDPSGHESYYYDAIGDVQEIIKKIGSTSYTTTYAYNSGGQLTKITYPSGRVVYYNYDNVGHLCQVASASSTSCNATSPYLALPSSSYDAAGRPLSATYGNGVVATAAYSPQTFELTSLAYAKGTTTLLGLNYYYQQNSTYCPTGKTVGNNGQIQCIADVSAGTGDSGRSAAYTYDALGRLLTAQTTGSTQYPAWGLSFTYDRYGNRTAQTVTAGSGYNTSFTINPVNNQITSPALTYDAAGNVIAEPAPLSVTSTYNGEECNTGYTGNGSTATYTCDGNNLRVEKVVTGTDAVTTVYLRSGGQAIAEYDNGAAATSPTREYLYGHNLLAIVTGSTSGSGGTIIYQHRDTLSPRLYTDVNGNCVGDQGTYPFGELWYSNNDTSCTNTTSTPWIFTSYERDTESGNDYALARSYASGQGRFVAPDPLEGVLGDPQSWNRYAYVENDPIDLSDPSGQGFWSSLFDDVFSLFVDLATGDLINLAYGGNVLGNPSPLPPGCSDITCTGPPIFSQNGAQNGAQDATAQGTQQPGPTGISVPVGGGPGPGPTAPGGAGNAGPGGQGAASPGSGTPGPTGGTAIGQPTSSAPGNSSGNTSVLYPEGDGKPYPANYAGWWGKDWKLGHMGQQGTCCSQTDAEKKTTVSLSEQINGRGPWQSGGEHVGGFEDLISPEPRTITQRFFANGKQLRVVLGYENGRLVVTSDVQITVYGDSRGTPPKYSPSPF
ncbi:MAG: RHS repeat-associated core domain-containing protein [Terriglobales bacterium]